MRKTSTAAIKTATAVADAYSFFALSLLGERAFHYLNRILRCLSGRNQMVSEMVELANAARRVVYLHGKRCIEIGDKFKMLWCNAVNSENQKEKIKP